MENEGSKTSATGKHLLARAGGAIRTSMFYDARGAARYTGINTRVRAAVAARQTRVVTMYATWRAAAGCLVN